MKRTAGNLIFWQTIVRSVAMTVLVGILEALAFAQTISDLSGVRNSTGMRRLTDKQLQQIRETLSQKSGFVELSFDSQGALTLGLKPDASFEDIIREYIAEFTSLSTLPASTVSFSMTAATSEKNTSSLARVAISLFKVGLKGGSWFSARNAFSLRFG